MLESMDHWQLRAALEWQAELGADEALGDVPVNRYETPDKAPDKAPGVAAKPPADPMPGSAAAETPEVAAAVTPDLAALAAATASQASDLAALKQALETWEHCELKRGARNLVFADGNPAARLMVIGEAPGRDEDRQGRPFVGAAGQLLDRMLAAIELARDAETPDKSVYITNILPWRPPQNRDPNPDEIAQMRPFILRHIELVQPDVLIVMGNIACDALLGKRGITRLRGTWHAVAGRPAMPMFHPAYLLRTPGAKRDAWGDLLQIQAKLKAGP